MCGGAAAAAELVNTLSTLNTNYAGQVQRLWADCAYLLDKLCLLVIAGCMLSMPSAGHLAAV